MDLNSLKNYVKFGYFLMELLLELISNYQVSSTNVYTCTGFLYSNVVKTTVKLTLKLRPKVKNKKKEKIENRKKKGKLFL